MSSAIARPKKAFPFKSLIVPGVGVFVFSGITIWGFTASGLTQPLIILY